MPAKMIQKKENIFGDNIAFIEHWDFSKANLSQEDRINAITQVASICYQSPKALGSEALYNRLMAESMGLPSSSFEFVPVLLDYENQEHQELLYPQASNVRKYGEQVVENDKKYLLTNYRALVYDYEENKHLYTFDIRDIFNTIEEAAIIAKYFHVFLFKIDLPTRTQMIRHRVNWQELSRRYVSGKRVPFSFYISEKMKGIEVDGRSTQDVIDYCVEHYYKAIDSGVLPQEARRIIPQAAYSQIWGGFTFSQMNNFFRLRLDEHAQWEIRKVAEAMRDLVVNAGNK